MDWNWSLGEVLLPALKIAAIVFGACVAVAELLRDESSQRFEPPRRRRRAAVLLIVSLGSAVAAEVVDALLKHADGARLHSRLSSSLRPLLPVRVAVSITGSEQLVRDPAYSSFYARVEPEVPTECDFEARIRYGDGWFPRRSEVAAWQLAAAAFRADVAFQPKGRTADRLAFTAVVPTENSETARLKRRLFGFDRISGLVVAEAPRLISAGDLISDSPNIAAVDDLAGAKLLVELECDSCPGPVDLYEVTIQLPDGRLFSVHRDEFTYHHEDKSYSYSFPDSTAELFNMVNAFPAFRVLGSDTY